LGTGSAGVIGTVGNLTLNTSAQVGAITVNSNTSDTTSLSNIGLLSIASGSTLTASSFTVGVAGITGSNNTLTALGTGAAGTGGTLRINGNFNMSQAGGNNSTDAAITVVDLSGLHTVNVQAPAGSLSVGSNLRSRGTLTLADNSNTLNVGTLSLGVTGNNSSGMSTLNLGAGTNALQAPIINIGAGKAGGLIQFAGPDGSVVITGAGGSGSSTITIGNANNGTYTGGNNSLLLAGSTATVTASTVTIGQKASNSGGNVGAFVTFDTGTFTATTIQMGVAGGTSSGIITSSFTVGGATANSAATGVVNINGNLLIAAATAGSATPNSTLTINGGTVNVNTAASAANGIFDTSTAAGTSTTTLTLAGGTLNLNGGSIGGTTGTGRKNIGTLNFQSGTLQNVSRINDDAGLTKTTAGTLVLSGANTYSGPTAVTGGTLALGASNAIPSTAVSIGNATLNAATFTDTVGTLAVNGSASVNLGAGASLAFANSNAIPWPGTLALTGTFVPGSSLRFGTTGGGLTSTQLGKISATGFTGFALDDSGFLTAIPDGFASWINSPFANGQLPLDQRGANDDPDNDGIRNLIEYAIAGQDPTVSNASIGTFNGTTLGFDKRAGTSGLTYAIETSTDLGTTDAWAAVTGVPPDHVNDPSTISYTLTAGNPARIFARLRVRQVP
jgi:hypothetical protein